MKQPRLLFFPLSLVVLLSGATLANAAEPRTNSDWPQWRGPNKDGISAETQWTDSGRPLWKTSLGLGYSTVSIRDGRLYTMGYDKDVGSDIVFCFDAETGEELWHHAYSAEIWSKFHTGGTLSTPTIDDDRLLSINREGRFFALNLESGDVLAEREFVGDFELELPTWGFSTSPLVSGDLLVLNLGRVIALDRESLEVAWATETNYGHAYSTPAEFEYEGRTCLAVFNGAGLAVLDRKDGSQLALHEWRTRYDVNAATPIIIGDTIFISSGYNHGCALLKFTGDALEVVWENKEMRNKMSGCVLIDGHLYGFDENELKCIDLTGKTKWAQRGLGNGAVLGAGERIVLLSGDGELIVAAANPEAFEELSREKVLDGGVYWTTPVLSGGRIYCRNSEGELVARDHRPAADSPGE